MEMDGLCVGESQRPCTESSDPSGSWSNWAIKYIAHRWRGVAKVRAPKDDQETTNRRPWEAAIPRGQCRRKWLT
jgi:hypothetical protein